MIFCQKVGVNIDMVCEMVFHKKAPCSTNEKLVEDFFWEFDILEKL